MKKYKLKINGNDYEVKVNEFNVTSASVELNGKKFDVAIEYDENNTPVIVPKIKKAAAMGMPVMAAGMPAVSAGAAASSAEDVSGEPVKAPMPGLMLKILVKKGASVSAGQKLAVMEAMKMENDINSPVAGTVKDVKVHEGDNVQEHEILFIVG